MTVKVSPKGSRGARVPRFLFALGAGFMVRQFRRKGGAKTQGGVDAILLETIGAKSGEVRRAVLGYLAEPDGSWLIIASLAGSASHPAWFHNLARNPRATIEFGDRRRLEVRAESLDGEALERAWERIATDAPEYVKYRSRTDRAIPVVRLTARRE